MDGEGTIVGYATGGLGDFVRTWPRLRQFSPCTIVTRDKAQGRLAEELIEGVKAANSKPWLDFFNGKKPPPKDVSTFDILEIFYHEVVVSESRLEALVSSVAPNLFVQFFPFHPTAAYVADLPLPANVHCDRGGLFHVGARRLKFRKGTSPVPFPVKDWDLDTSLSFFRFMEKAGERLDLIAGPSQEKEWSRQDLKKFRDNDGVICHKLAKLASRVQQAKFFVGFDSGPTHLAAQLGKPTIALYGPTGPNPVGDRIDLKDCEPIGPLVEVLAPQKHVRDADKPKMRWLTPQVAAQATAEFVARVFEKELPSVPTVRA